MTKPRRISTLTAALLSAVLATGTAGASATAGRPDGGDRPPSPLAAVEALLEQIRGLLAPPTAAASAGQAAADGAADDEGIDAAGKTQDEGPVIDPAG